MGLKYTMIPFSQIVVLGSCVLVEDAANHEFSEMLSIDFVESCSLLMFFNKKVDLVNLFPKIRYLLFGA